MKKTSQITIFVFAALLVALPMTTSNVFAETGVATANLEASCGITVENDGVDLGVLKAGAVGTQGLLTIVTNGTILSDLQVTASDWTGDDSKVHLLSEVTRYALVIDSADPVDPIIDYDNKLSLNTSGVIKELAAEITPEFDIYMYLQISAQDGNLKAMPYSGELEQTLTFESNCVI